MVRRMITKMKNFPRGNAIRPPEKGKGKGIGVFFMLILDTLLHTKSYEIEFSPETSWQSA